MKKLLVITLLLSVYTQFARDIMVPDTGSNCTAVGIPCTKDGKSGTCNKFLYDKTSTDNTYIVYCKTN